MNLVQNTYIQKEHQNSLELLLIHLLICNNDKVVLGSVIQGILDSINRILVNMVDSKGIHKRENSEIKGLEKSVRSK